MLQCGFVRAGTLVWCYGSTHVGVMVGESVTLTVSEHVYVYCNYIDCWHNSDMILRNCELTPENDADRFNFSCDSGRHTCELTILNAQIEDSGEYFCADDWHMFESNFRVTLIRKLFRHFHQL